MNKVIKICLWALALTPFMVDKYAFFPFATGEALYVRGLLVLAGVLLVGNFFYDQKFRNEITEKTKSIIKQPLTIALMSFVGICIISTIFAINTYNAFWGTIERTEGLVGISYFFALFVFSVLLFERDDWLTYFKINVLVSFVLICKEFLQFFSGSSRPSSFLDNPTYLSGYLISSLFFSLVVFGIEKNKSFKYFSIITLFLSVLGIFMTQTRGTILGLAVGVMAILSYFIIKGRHIFYKKITLRTYALGILCCIVLFSGVFISTRKNEVWLKIPGFSRIATVDTTDSTINSRLLLTKLSIHAINPKENGLKKFLIGWGPENFSLVYSKYFNSELFLYDMGWFDRSHNKLIDILVMNGIFGLIAYLTLYFFLFRYVLKQKEYSLVNAGLLFFGVSILVHLLFVFDQITTSIPFFAVLSFVVYLSMQQNAVGVSLKKHKEFIELSIVQKVLTGVFLLVLVLFLSFVYIRNDIIAAIQMNTYLSLSAQGDIQGIVNNTHIFKPFTPAQMNIRQDLLLSSQVKKSPSLALIALMRGDEYIVKDPFDIRFIIYIAGGYSNVGKDSGDINTLKTGEMYFRKMLIYIPRRPDISYGLALNLFYQKRYNESFALFEKVFNSSQNYFLKEISDVNVIYLSFLEYFYQVKDTENFTTTAIRLEESGYLSKEMFDQIINYIEKYKSLPNIDFRRVQI